MDVPKSLSPLLGKVEPSSHDKEISTNEEALLSGNPLEVHVRKLKVSRQKLIYQAKQMTVGFFKLFFFATHALLILIACFTRQTYLMYACASQAGRGCSC